MDAVLHDLRFAVRQLRRTPGFVITVVLTLALGIGANTAIFSLLDQALLRALPVRDPGQLALLSNNGGDWEGGSNSFGGDIGQYFSYPMYRDLQARNTAFQDLAATTQAMGGVSITQGSSTELVSAEVVSGNYFETLGLLPAAGRLFTPADDAAPGSNPVVVLSARLWQQHFGGNSNAIGQMLSINGHPFQIVGVASADFQSAVWGQTPSLFVPMSMLGTAMPGSQARLIDHQNRWLNIFGRLKRGQTLASAQVSLEPLWHALRAEELKALGHRSPRFVASFLNNSRLFVLRGARGLSYSRESLKAPLLAVMGMATLVLLMAAVNVASLLLVRSTVRLREFSLRFALGASAGRVLSQLFLEGMIIGLLGGLLGLLLAPLALHGLVHRLTDADNTSAFTSALDLKLLLFTFGVSLVLSVLFSVAPALQLRRPDLVSSLKQQSGTSSGGALHFRRVIVCLQVGLSVILLMGAGLFVRTMHNVRQVHAGFVTEHLLSFSIDPQLGGYASAQVEPMHQHLLAVLLTRPGVVAAAATTDPELQGSNSGSNVTIQGYNAGPEEDMNVESAVITPGYFHTLQLPLMAGREFSDLDDPRHAHVVLVNQAFVDRFLGGDVSRALGRRLARGAGNGLDFAEIIGVVQNAKHSSLRDKPVPTFFTPAFQLDQPFPMTYYVRSLLGTASTETAIRQAVHETMPLIASGDLTTMQATVESSLRNESLIEVLALAFGLLASILSGVGLYGVLAYNTAQRTREIGVRMALGATRLGVSHLVLSDTFKLAGLGLVLAIPCGILLARLVQSQLFGVSPGDVWTIAIVVLLVAFVALLAALAPAHRASSVDPMRALRTE